MSLLSMKSWRNPSSSIYR